MTYGYRREDGSWTGMIGEILEKRADMAIGDMRFCINLIGAGGHNVTALFWFFTVYWGDLEGAGKLCPPRTQATFKSPLI